MHATRTHRARGSRRAVAAFAAVALAVSAAAPKIADACGGYLSETALAEHAVAEDGTIRGFAASELRWQGPEGLEAVIARHATRSAEGASAEELAGLAKVADQVAEQRGALASGLYWHTDLDRAKARAAQVDRPILSLRLLGKLTDERSCANSRYFRTVLYSDPAVAAFLRDTFVLHWSTERPVPEITIDFGDGRKLVRTITGNSAHYVLDAEGKVLDVLPGLYAGAPFVAHLKAAAAMHQDVFVANKAADAADRAAQVARYHEERLALLRAAWEADLAAIPASAERLASVRHAEEKASRRAMRAATSKTMAELPMLEVIDPDPFKALEEASEPMVWAAIAERHAEWAELSDASRAVITREHEATAAGTPTATVEEVCARFGKNLVLDTVRNEYRLRRQLHAWMAAAPQPEFAALNERVYAELFAMPRSDDWLGLYEPDVYTALDGAGVVVEATPSDK